MLTAKNVIDFGKALISANHNLEDAKEAISNYKDYLKTFAEVDASILERLDQEVAERFGGNSVVKLKKRIEIEYDDVDDDVLDSYRRENIPACGSRSSSYGCGRVSSSHC